MSELPGILRWTLVYIFELQHMCNFLVCCEHGRSDERNVKNIIVLKMMLLLFFKYGH